MRCEQVGDHPFLFRRQFFHTVHFRLFPLDFVGKVASFRLKLRNRRRWYSLYSSMEGEGRMKQFVVTLTPGEDGYVVAECPSLPGCVSQGKTKEEALQNIKEAIEGILEVRRGMNNPISPPEVRFIEIAA
jgi:predicted RNase H-like HicB family nuclease